MEMERYRIETKPKCPADAMVCGKHYRISVLTGRLLRLEYSEDGVFEDRATQIVLCREFPHADFRVVRKNGRIELFTDSLHLSYDGQKRNTQYPYRTGKNKETANGHIARS